MRPRIQTERRDSGHTRRRCDIELRRRIAGPRAQGDYLATFTAFGASLSQAGREPVVYPPPYPGASVDTSGGLYRTTFAMPGSPVVVTAGAPASVDVMLDFFIEDAFGWRDTNGAGHVDGVFDLSLDTSTSERPEFLGVRGFRISYR